MRHLIEADVLMRPQGRHRGWVALAAVVFSLLAGPARAHVAAVCTATHTLRPGVVTFLIATYHDATGVAAGSASIKSPQGTVHEFAFNNDCQMLKEWDLIEPVSYFRQRLLEECVCVEILGCGEYDLSTKKCTSTSGDCPSIDPKDMQIDCFGHEDGNPSWLGQSWARIKGDDEQGGCAYGSPTRVLSPYDTMNVKVYVRRGRRACKSCLRT